MMLCAFSLTLSFSYLIASLLFPLCLENTWHHLSGTISYLGQCIIITYLHMYKPSSIFYKLEYRGELFHSQPKLIHWCLWHVALNQYGQQRVILMSICNPLKVLLLHRSLDVALPFELTMSRQENQEPRNCS